MANTKDMLKVLLNTQIKMEAQKELALQIVNYSDNWFGRTRGEASVIFEACSSVLKNHLRDLLSPLIEVGASRSIVPTD